MKQRANRIFLDSDKISRHLFCSICHQVFEQPSRLACGHTFCYRCIQQWASCSKLCPMCKNSLRHRKPQKDLIAAHMIDDLVCKCFHNNCQWTGVYSILRKHQRTCDHRAKRVFQQRNFNDIVQVNDDSQIKQLIQTNSKGKKKLKNQEQKTNQLPTFPQSQQQNQFAQRRSNLITQNIHNNNFSEFNNLTSSQQQNFRSNIQTNNKNQNSSSSSSVNLHILPEWISSSTRVDKESQKTLPNLYKQMVSTLSTNKKKLSQNLKNENIKKLTLQTQLGNLSFQQDDSDNNYRCVQRIQQIKNNSSASYDKQINLYDDEKNANHRLNKKINQKTTRTIYSFDGRSNNLSGKNQKSLFVSLNNGEEYFSKHVKNSNTGKEKEKQKQKQKQKQKIFDQQNLSDQSNPFDEPIIQNSQQKRSSKLSQLIVLDSQESQTINNNQFKSSNYPLHKQDIELSIQSGQLSDQQIFFQNSPQISQTELSVIQCKRAHKWPKQTFNYNNKNQRQKYDCTNTWFNSNLRANKTNNIRADNNYRKQDSLRDKNRFVLQQKQQKKQQQCKTNSINQIKNQVNALTSFDSEKQLSKRKDKRCQKDKIPEIYYEFQRNNAKYSMKR